MKGIAHFAVGVAVATFVPDVVAAAGRDLAFGPLVGGLAGLLPDTLDFKLFRFLERRDVEIDPALVGEDEGGLHGNWLDLLPMVRDAVHLAVPIAPRCRPDCRGLCPGCGANLNQGQCDCALATAPKARSGLRAS